MSDSGMQIRGDISSVLAQMRSMRESVNTELQSNLQRIDRAADVKHPLRSTAVNDTAGEFKTLLGDAIDSVNTLQRSASAQASAFARGESDDLVAVMIASQKASVGFQALTQVRNRVVSAYQDIMNMPI